MKKLIQIAVLCLFPLVCSAAQPWQEITMPTVADAALTFANPPKQYGAIHWAIWGGQITKERILSDIEGVYANGGGIYMINNSRGLRPVYLTPEYLDLVKFVVDECKKRGMNVWIEGDAGYPDGFAGGLIRKDYPQLGMQGIVPDAHCTIAGGQAVSFPLPTDTLGIIATPIGSAEPAAEPGKPIPLPPDGKLTWLGPSGSTWDVTVHEANGIAMHYSVVAGQTLSIQVPSDTTSIESGTRGGGGARGGRGGAGAAPQGRTILPVPANGQFQWTPPGDGNWDLTFVRHVYRSSPTRYSDREDGSSDKDSLYTEIDYLNPEATATYLKLIHETYEKVVGDEFGKTVMGWRLDETDYTGFSPWTPKLLETFKAVKGYDLQPYIAQMFAMPLTAQAQRVKADYWDVWSGMFRDNFYKPLQEWCRARGMDYMGHLNHEETQISQRGESMVSNEGSYWRDSRYLGVPGIDNLSQIGPGIVADFPKIAASAAHMNGRPFAWEEEGGDTGPDGKFIFDYQLARGVNYMNIRGLNFAQPQGNLQPLQNRASAIGWYVSRAQHLMALGRPAAQVALFHPTDSYWLWDQEADTVTVKLQMELIRHQIDFDHVDSDALGSYFTLQNDQFKNLSGQVYKAVIIPTSTAIEKSVLDRLRAFAAGGGKVVFVGRTPSMVVDQTFLHPVSGPPDLSFATLEPTPDITDRVIAALPAPDVKLDTPSDMINYTHRSLADGEVYFFFNESRQTLQRTATLVGTGQVQIWDAGDGTIHLLAGVPAANGSVDVPITLGPQGAMFIIIGPLPASAGQPLPTMTGSTTLAALDGDWSVSLSGGPTTRPLKSWHDLGADSFNGIARYSKTFDAPATLPQGQRLYLDLGEVNDVARINLNGTDFDAQGWPAYLWDVTSAIKPGANTLEVQVQTIAAGGRGGRAAGAAGRSAAGGRGRGGFGGGANAPAAPVSHGLLGPVRLIAQ